MVMFSHSPESLEVSGEPDILKTARRGSLELGGSPHLMITESRFHQVKEAN